MEDQLSLQQFITGNQITVPVQFIERFIYNYEHREDWIRSDKLFEWIGIQHYKRYDNFTKQLRIQLDDSDLKVWSSSQEEQKIGSGGCNKRLFLVSQRGIKVMAMLSDKNTRKYYADLEQLTFNFIDHQNSKANQTIAQQRQQIEELKAPKPASIYRIRDRRDTKLLYIGKDKSKVQNRPQQHITERRKIVDGFQLIDILLASMPEQEILIEIEQCTSDNVDELEKFYIQEEQPAYNIAMNGRMYRCPNCLKVYKTRKPFERHCTNCENQGV